MNTFSFHANRTIKNIDMASLPAVTTTTSASTLELVPRSNSPYDYHPITSKNSQWSISNNEVVRDTMPLCTVQGCLSSTGSSGTLQAPSPQRPQYQGNRYSAEDQKHFWYCSQCIVRDEVGGASHNWGFSSRAHTPEPSSEDQSTR